MNWEWIRTLDEYGVTPEEVSVMLAEVEADPTESVLFPLEKGVGIEELRETLKLPPPVPYPDRMRVLAELEEKFACLLG